MKIDKIQINNFRAFYGENIFQVDGKNCLIYGENGSGKSSFYMALKVFIESSEVHDIEIFDYSYTQIIKKYLNKDFETSLAINRFNQKNIFSYTDVDKEKLQEYYDELINFYEDYEVFDKLSDSSFNKYFNDFEKIRNKVNDQVYKIEFLNDRESIEETTPIKETLLEDYREALYDIEQQMLSLVTNVDEKEKHFINIKFNDGIDYTIGDERKNEVWRIDKIANCYKIMPFLDYKKTMKMYSSEDSQDRLNLYKLFINFLYNFYVSGEGQYLGLLDEEKKSKILANVLNDELLPLINNILSTFHTDLYIDKFEVINEKSSSKALVIKSLYNGKEIYDFNLFLNEARLSALSMAVYFASIIRMYEIADGKALKILVLDDILVGLDMGNRLNLIKVLEEYFSDFQIFMLTYDKAWYETFKNYRRDKNQWVDYELYKQKIKIEDREFEVPVKIELDNSNYMQRAEERFAKFDYPACANYLRKESEKLLVKNLGIKNFEGIIELSELKNRYTALTEELKNLNLDNILSDFNDDLGVPSAQTGKLFGKLKSLKILEMEIKKLLVKEDFLKLNQIKNTILNPLSHHDIESPIYKEELTKAIEIVKRLKK